MNAGRNFPGCIRRGRWNSEKKFLYNNHIIDVSHVSSGMHGAFLCRFSAVFLISQSLPFLSLIK